LLDWIFEGVISWIASIISQVFDAVSGLFLHALGTDMTAMGEYFPFVTKAFSLMQYIAWALLFLITLWQLFRSFGGPITEAENPWPLLARSALFALLIKYARPIFDRLLDITRAPYSIDEAWACFDGFEHIYGKGREVELAMKIKKEIWKELGFTVNIGISNNFLLSKMAGDLSKPDKVHTLFPEEIEKKMWPLPVSELFFVGRATTKKLFNLGIKTIGELANADEEMIRAHLKTMGTVVQKYARGGDLEPYMYTHEANKGYGNSLTAPQDIATYEYADHLLLSLCETVGVRLRTDNVKVRLGCIPLKYRAMLEDSITCSIWIDMTGWRC